MVPREAAKLAPPVVLREGLRYHKIMSVEQFEETLRQLLRREPFQPFMVELLDGRVLTVNHPQVAFGGGAATYFTPTYDLVEFACEEVQAIRLLVPGPRA